MEVTTFWGHILALGLTQMVDFTQLDPYAPELFLRGLKAAGARAVGIAHPFCVGEPVMAGCRFAMELHDWSAVDYIEVFNTAVDGTALGGTALGEALGGNRHALELWERLVLSGHRIAAVTGKDLHAVPGEQTVFTTYALTADDSPLRGADAVLAAILNQRTLLSKGIVLSNLWFSIPFSAMMMSAALSNVNDSYIESARDAGCGSLAILRRIILPLTYKDIIVSATFILMGQVGAFTIPYLTGPNNPKMLGILLYQQAGTYMDYERAAALSVLMFLLCLGGAIVYIRSNMK